MVQEKTNRKERRAVELDTFVNGSSRVVEFNSEVPIEFVDFHFR
jgi:hypothetical protein